MAWPVLGTFDFTPEGTGDARHVIEGDVILSAELTPERADVLMNEYHLIGPEQADPE